MKALPHQKSGVLQIEQWGHRALLADDMGLGKTYQALKTLSRAMKKPRGSRNLQFYSSLVVCPGSVKANWQREALTHHGIPMAILSGRKPPSVGFSQPDKHLIINYDILGGWKQWLQEFCPDFVIFDESHNLANAKSNRTRYAKEVCRWSKGVLCLTGTPAVNRPRELYPTLNILRPKQWSSWLDYVLRYCDGKRDAYGWDDTGSSNLEELYGKLTDQGHGVMIRRMKTDVLDLPPKNRVVVQLPIRDTMSYALARDRFQSWLRQEKKRVFTKNKHLLAMQRVGALKKLAAKYKVKAVKQWVAQWLDDNPGDKIVLFAHHKKMVQSLKRRFPDAVTITGDTPMGKRQPIVDRFSKDSKCRVIICNYIAGGVGLNLQRACTLAFVEPDYRPGLYSQAEDRIFRIGQTRPCNIYYLVAQNTIEERIYEIVMQKQMVTQTIHGGVPDLDFSVFHELLTQQSLAA